MFADRVSKYFRRHVYAKPEITGRNKQQLFSPSGIKPIAVNKVQKQNSLGTKFPQRPKGDKKRAASFGTAFLSFSIGKYYCIMVE
jgi:hypothetical protein